MRGKLPKLSPTMRAKLEHSEMHPTKSI
uniref:Uncharacterized protein n=1 Tax=Nelumbo nucifera TaxID=4432 RepID=A0A822ZVR3_NELNU|nr:TPA_asm: hypothetical protein HUJ06_016913 [Nelumbo nucifera]